MTADFLKWFLDQKPFRKSRLVFKNGFERFIDKPENVTFIDDNHILVGHDTGMGRVTIDLNDIEEIRQ